MKIGSSFLETIRLTADHIEQFAKFSGDYNPIHLDDLAAKELGFKSKIAHGMILASFISKIIATSFPGPGAIYLSQTLSFRRPVYVNDTIEFRLEVVHKKEDRPIYTIKTEVFNQNNELALEGNAIIMIKNIMKV